MIWTNREIVATRSWFKEYNGLLSCSPTEKHIIMNYAKLYCKQFYDFVFTSNSPIWKLQNKASNEWTINENVCSDTITSNFTTSML